MLLRMSTLVQPITGSTLRWHRRSLDVEQAQLGRRMGVARQRVSQIEAMALPSPRVCKRYIEALEALASERAAR